MKDIDHLEVVHQVAAEFWESEQNEITEELALISLIKHNKGKSLGVFPAFRDKPSVFFKIYYYDRGFNFEAEGLTAANTMPPITGVNVPKLIAIYSKYWAILTKKENWKVDRSWLQKYFVGTLKIDWYQLGCWLRKFHDTRISYEKNGYFLRKKFEKINSHLNNLSQLFTQSEIKKMKGIVEKARHYFDEVDIEWVISHGDFGLANFKTSKSSINIIDFEDCQMAPRAFDILNCLTRLEYMKFFPHLPKSFSILQQKLMDGYGIKLKNSSADNFFYLLVKLDVIETYHRRKLIIENQNKLIYSLFERKNLAKLSKWISDLP